jgi:hypothetical protein
MQPSRVGPFGGSIGGTCSYATGESGLPPTARAYAPPGASPDPRARRASAACTPHPIIHPIDATYLDVRDEPWCTSSLT